MFLRWQMRKSVASRHRESPPVRPVALLVESVRIDGKPHQRHVAYLFSIWHGEEDKLGDRHWQVRWWVEASDRLDELGDRVKPEDRRKIEKALAQKIGRKPTKAEVAKYWRRTVEIRRDLGLDPARALERAAAAAVAHAPVHPRSHGPPATPGEGHTALVKRRLTSRQRRGVPRQDLQPVLLVATRRTPRVPLCTKQRRTGAPA
jgi:hypothetical protein